MTWRSCIAAAERPTAKNMKQKKGKPLFTSLRQFSWFREKGRTGTEAMIEAYGKRIAECSTLVHDGEKGPQRRHRCARLEKRGSHKRRNPRNEGQRQSFGRDKRPPRQNGEVHAAHSCYDRASLQVWMNLFWLLTNGPRDKMDKAKRFLEMAFSKKFRIKYRDRFGKIEK